MPDPLLTRIMHDLASVRERHATFVEQHQMGVLAIPLHSNGTLLYRAPDHLEKHVMAPQPEDLTIDGHMVILKKRDQEAHAMDFNNVPALRLMVDGLRAPLAGDLTAMQSLFAIQASGDLARWHLVLTPITPVGKRFIRRIEIDGVQNAITAINATQANGNTDQTQITPIP